MILDAYGRPVIADNPYANAQAEAKPDGHILMDGRVIADTKRCIHGGEHFVSVKGSGVTRGWCMTCMGVTCGRPEHDACLHWEKVLDLYEKGKLSVLR